MNAVINREAGEDLLESFAAERRAIAVANTDLSVSNWKEALKVPRALGLDPAAANVLHSAVTSKPASMLPPGKLIGYQCKLNCRLLCYLAIIGASD